MTTVRIALANLPFPPDPRASVGLATDAIAQAAVAGAEVICFPEAYVPGYRAPTKTVAPPDEPFLERAWEAVATAAGAAGIGVVLGTERIVEERLTLTTLVVDREGAITGFQDKVQIDPSEEPTYAAGSGRRIFTAGPLTFGVAICHEGWRYPETVRWAARRGAHVVFHPHFHEAEPGSHRPSTFAEADGTFHEKALLCRAAENTCYIASVNCASAGSPSTSVVVSPDGTVLAYQPYGEAGLLVTDLELEAATGLYASRLRTID